LSERSLSQAKAVENNFATDRSDDAESLFPTLKDSLYYVW
jgi:hypothetical protein